MKIVKKKKNKKNKKIKINVKYKMYLVQNQPHEFKLQFWLTCV